MIEHEKWRVIPLELTLDKTKWLWEEMNKYRTLFSDLTRGDVNNFESLIMLPDSVWLEILENDVTVGIVYWTGMYKMLDADVHIMFFDRKPAEKADLCKLIAGWFFNEYPQFHRMTATLPHIYHATIRLAEKIGFKFEGSKRQSQLMGGNAVDEVIMGLTIDDLNDEPASINPANTLAIAALEHYYNSHYKR